jgi:sugar O-acyltransferase (sialic acid O-acetyltransferase NeuD family)
MQYSEVVLYGAGGAGRELAMMLKRGKQWQIKGYVDDTMMAGTIVNGVQVLGGMEWLEHYEGSVAMCIVGSPVVKRMLIERVKETSRATFPLMLNEESIVSDAINWGEGCIVALPFNHITVNIKIGKFVWINSGNLIGHDVEIGCYSTLFSAINVGGGVHIGKDCVIGIWAIINPGVTIGDGCIIGGGAVVVSDIPDGMVAAGCPAKIIKANGA